MLRAFFITLFAFLLNFVQLKAEGSVDFINYPGYRLFLRADFEQQIKAYAKAGEFLNIGSSHVGWEGGFIEVYKPDGTLHSIFDGSNGSEAIIFNSIQELNGPIGDTEGYTPGVIQVTTLSEGIWSFVFKYPETTGEDYDNLLNNQAWERATDQPSNKRVVLAWDVTVSENAAGNNNGNLLTGRVYSNEYNSMIDKNGFTTSPSFYVLTPDGLQYQVDFLNADPFGFPISCSSTGIVKGDMTPTYMSWSQEDFIKTTDAPSTWSPTDLYQYHPQVQDTETIKNNKIFFNIPNPDMPLEAMTTDVFRANTYSTWLYKTPSMNELEFNGANFFNPNNANTCNENIVVFGGGVYFNYYSSLGGLMELQIDVNNNGTFEDDVDVEMLNYIEAGGDSLYWNLVDGQGNSIDIQNDYSFGFQFNLRRGECHILLSDVENNLGGVTIELISDIGTIENDLFYYDHSNVEGTVSGGGEAGEALPTNIPFTYDNLFGNKKMLDYWAYNFFGNRAAGDLTINIVEDCDNNENTQDTDLDGIPDIIDLDDDNDGLSDVDEYCPGAGFTCLPGGVDPSADEDNDGILNYLDADDTAFDSNCTDTDLNGICDNLPAIFDTDLDGVPDHLDLDSDNDGILDLYEAGHGVLDENNDGIIDGDNALFGLNGFFNDLATSPDDLDAIANYTPWDFDQDGILDADDLDSDNDGINDVIEAGHGYLDPDNDGTINLQPTLVDENGIAIFFGGIANDPIDSDNDGIVDFHDLDSDNDGINDVEEAGIEDLDNDGISGTGIPDINDNGQTITGNTSFPVDTDNDNIPDYLDLDSDNDMISDVVEGGNLDPDNDGIVGVGVPMINTNGQANETTSTPPDTDNDSVSDYQDIDSDGDGILDEYECPNDNICIDTDSDGIPDYQDIDSDGDGILDEYECPNDNICIDTDSDGIPDYQDIDSDGDGILDEYECPNDNICIDTDNDGIPDYQDIDSDGDGILDEYECPNDNICIDTDSDGIPDYQDIDSDGDGILDEYECPNENICIDTDSDGIPDYQDIDSDGDGILDEYECETGYVCPDTDNDNTPDYQDTDTDNDGIADEDECPNGAPCPDEDEDGIPDWRDPELDCLGENALAITELFGGNTYCEGTTFTLSGTINMTDQAILYTWTGPEGFLYTAEAAPNEELTVDIITASTLAEGAYTLNAETVDGCPALPMSLIVNIIAQPTTPLLTITDSFLCEGENLTLNATPTIGENPIYHWFFDAGNGAELISETSIPTLNVENIDSSNSGIYSVLVVDGTCFSGTSNLAEVTITSVSEEIAAINTTSAENPACSNSEVSLSVPYIEGASYVWFDENDLVLGNMTTITLENVTENDAGMYYAIINLEECGEITSLPTQVFVNGIIITPQISPDNDEVCAGEDVNLIITNELGISPTDAVEYVWYESLNNTEIARTESSNIVLENLEISGEYYVVAIINGCAVTSENCSIQVNNTPDESANIEQDELVICQGDVAVLQATEPIENQGNWTSLGTAIVLTPNNPISQVVNLEEGINTFVWTLSNLTCDVFSSDTIQVVEAANIIANDDVYFLEQNEQLEDENILQNDEISADGSIDFEIITPPLNGELIDRENGTITYISNDGFVGEDNFIYQICSTECADMCEEATVNIVIQNSDFTDDCFIPNGITPNEDGKNDALVFPCFDNNQYPDNHIIIFNRLGDKVYEASPYNNDWKGTYKGKELPAGTYFFILEMESGANPIQEFFTIIY